MLRLVRSHRQEIIILVMFLSFLTIQLLILASGFAWVYVDPDQISFWLLVFVALLAIVAGIVSTYSFVQYTQEGSFRSFMITLLGANVVLLAFLYLLTHPVTTWSIFSDRRRNMTIATALGLLITPGILGGSFVGHRSLTHRFRNIALLWGAVVQPFVSLWLCFSPEPVFVLTGAGFGGLTFMGWMLSIIFGTSSLLSLVLYVKEWTQTREHITLASSLALVLWILSFLIYLAIESPLQVAELLWFSGIADGFVLLAVTMIIASIIDPHRVLESVVKERTVQLEESRKETEFYLKLWTHKIGNLLQGLSTYLELIGYETEKIPSLSNLQKPAMDLVRESVFVNRQVVKLTRIKEKTNSATWPVELNRVLIDSEKEMREILEDESFALNIPDIHHQIQIIADDLIDIVFINLMTKCTKQCKTNRLNATIRITQNQDSVQVYFGPCSLKSVSEIKEWSKFRPPLNNSVVDLDLFMAWLIMERYGGRIEHNNNLDSNKEELVLTFKRAT